MNDFELRISQKEAKVKEELLDWLGDIAENLDRIARVLETNGKI